jgi:predicted secreted hydrolase
MHQVEPIVPKDDGFHGANKLSAEWWYFDGVFSDEYSFHIGIRTFTRKKRGRAIIFFELYQKEEIIFEKKKRYQFKDIITTNEYPSVQINDHSILEFDMKQYQERGEWIYHISLAIDDCNADLYFHSITQGFKIETEKESWTVAVPKAKITGTIKYGDKKLSVNGIGYHDHNWNYTIMSAITYGKGWYWGKIKSDTFTIIWANVLKRSGFEDLLAIVCPDHNGFYNISPDLMKFEVKKYTTYHRRKIPSIIHLSFQQTIDSTPINVDVVMEVNHVHFTKVFFASYWRYHVNITGFISVDNKTEQLNIKQIMEYLSMI